MWDLLDLNAAVATVAKVKRAKRITGLGVAARALGVTRHHLGWVLHGRRTSPTLVARYNTWRANQPQESKGNQ